MADDSTSPNAARGPGRPTGGQAGEAREALLRAAHEVMAEKGYPRVTVREVAERAGVQPALVNYHFGGKQGLLRSVVGRIAEEMHAPIRQAMSRAETPEDAIRELVRGVVRAVMAAPYGPRLVVEQVLFAEGPVIEEFVEKFARPTVEDVRARLAEGQSTGALRPADLRFAIPALFGACIFFFLGSPLVRRLHGIDEIDDEIADRFAESTAELLLHGFAADRGAA
jgi:TetR/AcrR family transcriptional regulator